MVQMTQVEVDHGVPWCLLRELRSYNMPARNPTPAPRLIRTHPAPMAPDTNSVLPAEPVMFMPAIAVPVAVVMLIPLIPLIPLMLLMPLITSPLDIVIEASIDMPLMSDAMEEPLAATAAAAVGSLSHIIVTISAPDAEAVAEGFAVIPDCATAVDARARTVTAKTLECILDDMLRLLVD